MSVERLTAPASPNIVQAGSIIPAALITGVRSDLPGQITAQVTQNVYDSPTGRILLIPQGARLIGEYDSEIGPSGSSLTGCIPISISVNDWFRSIRSDERSGHVNRIGHKLVEAPFLDLARPLRVGDQRSTQGHQVELTPIQPRCGILYARGRWP